MNSGRRVAAKNQPLKSKLSVDRRQKSLGDATTNTENYGGRGRFQARVFRWQVCRTQFAGDVFLVTVQHYSPKRCTYRRQKRYVSQPQNKDEQGFHDSFLLKSSQNLHISQHLLPWQDCKCRLAAKFRGSNAARAACDQKIFLRKRDKLHLRAIKETSACCVGAL